MRGLVACRAPAARAPLLAAVPGEGVAWSASEGRLTAPVAAVRVVTVALDELGALVRDAVADALADAGPGEGVPALLDVAGLAQALGCSPSTVHRLRKLGMPHVRLGDDRRFRLERVLEWLEAREGTPAQVRETIEPGSSCQMDHGNSSPSARGNGRKQGRSLP